MTGKLFLPSKSRSLALTQKRVQHLSCFSTTHRGSFAPCCGRAAGTWTKRTCSSTPFFVSYKGKHWCLGLELQKLCLHTTTKMLEHRAEGHWGFGHTWGPHQGLPSLGLAGHGHKTLQEGRCARAIEVLTGFALCGSRPQGPEKQ